MSAQLNQHQAVQSERSLELAVLAGGCFWVEHIRRDDTRIVCAAAHSLSASIWAPTRRAGDWRASSRGILAQG
jgi:hypothetical protein